MIFFNIGVLHYDYGDLEKSAESYAKAISLDKKNISAWNNLYYALKALNVTRQSLLQYSSLWKLSTQYSDVLYSTLNYKLFCGDTNNTEHYLNAVSKLSNFNNTKPKKNLGYDSGSYTGEIPEDIVAMIHFGRSGTGLVHSLFDGHPSISTLPSIYFSQYFDPTKWEKLTKFGPEKLVDQFASIYDVFFDSRSNIPITDKSGHPVHNIGILEGMTTLGDNKEYSLKIDKVSFCKELKALVYEQKSLDPLLFLNLYTKYIIKLLMTIMPKS